MTLNRYKRFFITLLFLLFAVFLLETTKTKRPSSHYELMWNASKNTETAFSLLKEEKIKRGHTLSLQYDPNQTGMIGEPYTMITTTLGGLEAKRSTTNPNVAAMIVEMLVQCGVKKGDSVAVNMSGSFPCLNIAVLCALDAMEINGTIICSVGASTYGANLPDFTYPDMEQILLKHQIISNHSSYFSMGGSGDLGEEMPADIKNEILERLSQTSITYLAYEDQEENIAARKDIYQKNGTISCFINVGGNLLAFAGEEAPSASRGIFLPGQASVKGNGLIAQYLREGVPVISLLNVKSLLSAYGLPYDPSPIPAVGEGEVYETWYYSPVLTISLFLIAVSLMLWTAKGWPHKQMPL